MRKSITTLIAVTLGLAFFWLVVMKILSRHSRFRRLRPLSGRAGLARG